MADKLLICVSAEQATAALSRRGKLAQCQVFRNDDRGAEAFDRLLAQLRNVPVHVMVDVVEEDYRFEMLPHASGRDRSELIERRLRQLYRNTPYCAALPQGRDSGKRRDDQYLFFALINPDLIESWLARIRVHDLPVAGVYLLPVLAEPLAQKLAPGTPNLLLVAQHPSGLRLTFFRHGKLRVSRLTRVESTDPRGRVAAYTEEIANTRLYLHALRAMSLDEHLAVIALDRDASLSGLEQAVARDISNAQATRLGSAEIAKLAGVPEPVVHDVPDALYLHLLGAQPPRGNLAPELVTERFQIYQLRRALYATAGVAAVASVAWLALNAYQIYDLRSEQAHAVMQTADYQRRYQEVTRHFPAAPTSADNLVQAVQTAERMNSIKRTPESAMIVVGRALEQFPNVYLKGFGWKYAARSYDADGTARRSDGPPQAAPGTPQGRRQSAFVEGEIRPFNGDYRAALDTISSFAATLRQDAAVAEVNVVALPLNVSPTMALSGSTTETAARATSAPFRLNIAFKPTL
ncbi:MAG: hypothetical protein EHM59_06770 [Betaproteobacteria bacterium]|nr:MAG: hypothetical protein EHM59_06770 [Betaproteobacteria bacterium]